jgi:hypothetical protein
VEAIMQTHVTSREVPRATASDCVEGTPVRSTDGISIGTIEGVIIDKASGNVSYAVLRFNGSVQMGRRHLAIPWHGLTYDRKTATYNLDLAENDLIALSRAYAIDQGNRGAKSERSDGRMETYWGIAETW